MTVSGKDFCFTTCGLPESKMLGQRPAFRGAGIEREARVVPAGGATGTRQISSKRLQECYQVGLLLIGETDSEALVVEIYDVLEGRRRAVMEVGRTRR